MAEKQSVTLVLDALAREASCTARSPSGMSGTLTTMFLWILAISRPSLQDRLVVDREHLAGDGAVDDLADLGERLLHGLAALGEERRVGGHAVEQPHRRRPS